VVSLFLTSYLQVQFWFYKVPIGQVPVGALGAPIGVAS
jgi:hypothetical protein